MSFRGSLHLFELLEKSGEIGEGGENENCSWNCFWEKNEAKAKEAKAKEAKAKGEGEQTSKDDKAKGENNEEGENADKPT